MVYWIQEFGGNGQNRYNFRFYHCDYETDITKLPTNTAVGEKQGNDEISCTKAHYGDLCLCLETSEVYELRNEPNDWKKL